MELADKRLGRVLDKFTERICQKQTLSMRQLSDARREEIQFGRFLGNKSVAVSHLEEQLYRKANASSQHSDHVLLIEDSSQISFSLDKAITGLGKVDKGQVQGFYLHPVLCLDAADGTCHGVPSLEFRLRPFPAEPLTRQQIRSKRNQIPFEEKEAYRWFSCIVKALLHCRAAASKTVIADREADIYPLLVGLKQDLQLDYIIRAKHDRPLQAGSKLFERINSWSVAHEYKLTVPATDKRSAHEALLGIKYGQVVLKRPVGKTRQVLPLTHTTWAVEVKESTASVVGKEMPIHWILLTSHPVEDHQMALQIIGWYKERWHIEQLFRTLKNKGLRLESSQVSDYEKLQKLAVLALSAVVRVMQLLRARQGAGLQTVTDVFEQTEQQCLLALNEQLEGKTEKQKNPHARTHLAFAAWVIARLGGWKGYQSQRPPGPIDLLTGLKRFQERYLGYLMALNISSPINNYQVEKPPLIP